MMTASELMEALKTRPSDARIVVTDGQSLTAIKSVPVFDKNEPEKNESDKTVLLAGEPVRTTMTRASQILAEAMIQAPDNYFSGKVVESDDEPGTFQVQIAGSAGEFHGRRNFDTRAEGQSYISGFVFGFTVGGGLKEIAEGHPPRRT